MILAVLAIGGTLIAATTIAGLLMVYQIRQATDLEKSARAIFAADAGIEWGLYQFFQGGTGPFPPTGPVFTNGAAVSTTCFDAITDPASPPVELLTCSDLLTTLIRGTGVSGEASRAFELDIGRP
jgi:hypothetical protein